MPTDAAAVEADLRDVIAAMGDMDPSAAEAHAIGAGAVAMLRILPRGEARDDYGHALVARAPSLAAEVRHTCAHSVTGAVSPSHWRSFPVDALGWHVGRYVEQVATAIGCDESMVALPALACLAGVVGNRRVVRLRQGWTEPAVVWCAVVARSGTKKSPAQGEVTRPLRYAETMEIDEHQRRRAEHERDLEAWRDAPRKGRPERPPAPPPARRLVVSDITVEALALRLSESPGGLLVNRDELAGWVRSFDRYRGGRGGDAQAWLEMHRAGSIIVDRRSGEVLSVRRAAVSIIGGVQPEVLAAALAGEHVANGLAARILYAMPPTTPARWTDAEVGDDLRTDWATLLDELRDLRYEMDPVDEHRPVALPLTADAREMYRRWHDWRAERIADAESDALAAAGAKVQGYAARLALLRQLADDANADAVGVEAMTAGIEMADWFANEAARVYSTMTERPEDHERRRLVDWIIGKGGAATERELSRGPRQYRGPGAATVALDNLVRAGVGRWLEVPAGPDGGRPTRRFLLPGGDEIRGGDGDETPQHGAGDETRRNPNVAAVADGDTTPKGLGGSVAVAGGEHAKTDDEGQLDLDDEGPMPWGGMNL